MQNIKLLNCNNSDLTEDVFGNGNVCIVTDPPYNMNYHYKSYNDNMPEHEYLDWICGVFTKFGFPFVVIHYPEMLYKIAIRIGKAPERVISWVYNSNTQRQHRDIAFFGIKPDLSLVKQPYKNQNDKRIQARIAEGKGCSMYDWLNINQIKNVSKEKTEHPCQIPLVLMRKIIGVIPSDYTVYDPFMGSGTTGVACKTIGRKFIGCEIDKEYFKIAKKRMDNILW